MKPSLPLAPSHGIARFRGALALLAALGAVGLVVACAETTPQSATVVGVGTVESDGGELTCDERARAQVICQSAILHRCESQQNDCEGSCDVHGDLPGNNEKSPSQRNDMESTQCRANCVHVHDGCVRSAPQQCPVPCG
jgi:hypothetical protein